ncbi:MAG: MarR family transcriptional regulator [Pseudomonadota bacterium]
MAARLNINRTDLRGLNALEHGPLTPGELGDRLGLTSGSVTALIERLIRESLVERVASADDGRSVKVSITQDRYGELSSLYGSCAKAIAQSFAGGTEPELLAAAQALQAFASAIEAATATLDDTV